MNNLSSIRKERGYVRQADFAAAVGIDYIDGSVICRFERDQSLPVQKDAEIIAQKLGVKILDIWPEYPVTVPVHAYHPSKSSEAIANGSKAEIYGMVTQHIQVGRHNAISREMLMLKTGLSDRKNREAIEAAVNDGILIINLDHGYFIPDRIEDIRQWYYRELARSTSNYKKLGVARRILDELNVAMSGQMKFGQCFRCGDETSGDFCENCMSILQQRKDRLSSATASAAQE